MSPHLPKDVQFRAGGRSEYLKLTLRQLRVGKVILTDAPQAVAGTFVVGKPASGRLREVWNRSLITEAAARPPKPPLQANLAALAELGASAERLLWMSGRGARVFFD